MKFVKPLLVLSLVIFSFSSAVALQSVSGKIKNSPANGKIYLYEYFGSNFYVVDSAKLKNGEFRFAPKTAYPRGFYQLGASRENSAIFILGNEEISAEADWNDIKTTLAIKNSAENENFNKMMAFNAQIGSFEGQAKALMPLRDTSVALYNLRIGELQKKYDSLNTANNAFKQDIMTNKTNLYFSKVLKMFTIDGNTPKESYFATAEFSDPEYSRGDMLLNKLAFYLQKFGNNDPETWKTEAVAIGQKFAPKSKNKELAHINMVQLFFQNQLQPPAALLTTLKTEFATSTRAKEFVDALPKPAPQEGDPAPEIALTDPTGKTIQLSSLKGQIVLIDFWASWCGPCRMENPNVVNTYKKYKEKGFAIYSVSLDNNKQNWLNAIQKDGLTWPSHVSDLKGWQSEGAAIYQVSAIPATFLIDKNGVIVAKNLRGAALEQKLAELLP